MKSKNVTATILIGWVAFLQASSVQLLSSEILFGRKCHICRSMLTLYFEALHMF